VSFGRLLQSIIAPGFSQGICKCGLSALATTLNYIGKVSSIIFLEELLILYRVENFPGEFWKTFTINNCPWL
jgi:hypothetical protein